MATERKVDSVEWGLDESTEITEPHFDDQPSVEDTETPEHEVAHATSDAQDTAEHRCVVEATYTSLDGSTVASETRTVTTNGSLTIPGGISLVGNILASDQSKQTMIRFIYPTSEEIYATLKVLGLIDVSMVPPESYKNGTPIQQSLYKLHHINPAGSHRTANRMCSYMTTKCKYARFVTIVYMLVDGQIRPDIIDAISVEDFLAVHSKFYPMLNGMCSLYAAYVNACAHVSTFVHPCSPHCIIETDRYHIPLNDETLRAHVGNHMLMHYHAHGPAHRGPHGSGPHGSGPRGPHGPRVYTRYGTAPAPNSAQRESQDDSGTQRDDGMRNVARPRRARPAQDRSFGHVAHVLERKPARGPRVTIQQRSPAQAGSAQAGTAQASSTQASSAPSAILQEIPNDV